jgi:hypothetical protein
MVVTLFQVSLLALIVAVLPVRADASEVERLKAAPAATDSQEEAAAELEEQVASEEDAAELEEQVASEEAAIRDRVSRRVRPLRRPSRPPTLN